MPTSPTTTGGLKAAWLPIILFEIYLNLSVILFATGPWPWPVTNPWELYGFLFAAHALLGIGYVTGIKKAEKSYFPAATQQTPWLKWSLIANLALLMPTSFSRSGHIIPDLLFGLQSPGEAYSNAVERSADGGAWVIIEYFRILLAPLLAFAFPYVIVTWNERTTVERLACLVIVLFNVCLYISIATNKAIVDTVLLVPWLVMIGIATKHIVLHRRGKIVLTTISAVTLVLAFLFFGYGQTHRSGDVATGRTFGPPIFIDADPSNWLTSSFSETSQIYIESLLRYLCQGYYALSRAMLLDFDPTFGFGNSMFLAKNAEAVFGIQTIVSSTYPAKLEQAEGWGMFSLWHSIYPWLASDFGFFGTLVIVFFIGRYFAMSWIYVIRDMDKISMILFTYFLIMLIYFPGNNQLMQSPETCVGFLATLAIWMISKANIEIDRTKLRQLSIQRMRG